MRMGWDRLARSLLALKWPFCGQRASKGNGEEQNKPKKKTGFRGMSRLI